jgi:hypothetical protein
MEKPCLLEKEAVNDDNIWIFDYDPEMKSWTLQRESSESSSPEEI